MIDNIDKSVLKVKYAFSGETARQLSKFYLQERADYQKCIITNFQTENLQECIMQPTIFVQNNHL